MRFLNRLGTWLRPQSAEGLPAVVGPPIAGPAVAPEVFQQKLLATVNEAAQSTTAVLCRLDPTVFVLAIPSTAALTPDAELALSKSVDAALDVVKSQGRSMASLTWSALREARPAFGPSYLEWGKDHVAAFNGDISLLFFVDMAEISSAMAEAVSTAGFRARLSKKRPLLLVEDAKFRAHVGLNALIAEALWTADGPKAVIIRRARALSGEFRAFQSMLSALRRRFPQTQIDVDKAHFSARTTQESIKLDYRHLCAAARASGSVVDEWLQGMQLQDLGSELGTPGLMLRSPAYRRARPEVLAEDHAGYSLVAVRVNVGRVIPVAHVDSNDQGNRRKDEDEAESTTAETRMRFFREETARQIGTYEFEAKVLLPDDDDTQGLIALVGDGVASIALDGALVRAAVERFFLPPKRVKVFACAEDILVIADDDVDSDRDSAELDRRVQRAIAQAVELERALVDDPSDRLHFEAHIELPPLAAGRFHLAVVDEEVPQLLSKANDESFTSGQRDHLRGIALTLLGRLDAAVAALSRAVRTQREDPEVNLALGRAQLLNDAPEQAVHFLARAASLSSDAPEIANTLGLAQFGSGDVEGAIDSFEKACELAPDEPAFLVNLGRALVEGQRHQDAEQTLELALALTPNSAEANATMALLCHRIGDTARARSHASIAIALDPDDGGTRQLLLRLDKLSDPVEDP